MNSTWIRIGCACLGAIALAGCQQDRDTDDTDVTVTSRSRMEADERVANDRVEVRTDRTTVDNERMSSRAERVARTQFSGADVNDVDAVVSSSGETFYAAELAGDRQVIFDDDGVAVTDPIPDVSSNVDAEVTIERTERMD